MVKGIYNKKIIWYLVIVFFIIVFIYFSYQYAVSSKYIVSSEKAKKMIMDKKIDVVVLDVRTDAERDMLGYYPGSKHIQSADLEKRMSTEYPNKDIRIISYCNTGHRARMATEKLHELGYKNAMYISSTYESLM
jgi:rhodanese-related sulfurtransferase